MGSTILLIEIRGVHRTGEIPGQRDDDIGAAGLFRIVYPPADAKKGEQSGQGERA